MSVVEWFTGSHEGGQFELAGSRADGSFDPSTGSGTLHLGGTDLDFTLEAAEGDAGLYFDQVDVGDDENWGGWIVRRDGSLRGSVINRKTGGFVAAGNTAPGGQVMVDALTFDVVRLPSPTAI